MLYLTPDIRTECEQFYCIVMLAAGFCNLICELNYCNSLTLSCSNEFVCLDSGWKNSDPCLYVNIVSLVCCWRIKKRLPSEVILTRRIFLKNCESVVNRKNTHGLKK